MLTSKQQMNFKNAGKRPDNKETKSVCGKLGFLHVKSSQRFQKISRDSHEPYCELAELKFPIL